MGGMLYGLARRLVLKPVQANPGNPVLLLLSLHKAHHLPVSCSMPAAPKVGPFPSGPAAAAPKSIRTNGTLPATQYLD